jgi:hypothetical protein
MEASINTCDSCVRLVCFVNATKENSLLFLFYLLATNYTSQTLHYIPFPFRGSRSQPYLNERIESRVGSMWGLSQISTTPLDEPLEASRASASKVYIQHCTS